MLALRIALLVNPDAFLNDRKVQYMYDNLLSIRVVFERTTLAVHVLNDRSQYYAAQSHADFAYD